MLNINLKKRFKESVGGIVAATLTLCIIGGTNVMAGGKWGTYYLPKYDYVIQGGSKTTDNDYIGCQLENVFPTTSTKKDTYTKIKISAYFANNELVSERVITEGGYTRFQYKKDLKKNNFITIKMRGNNEKLAAFASIYLDVQ